MSEQMADRAESAATSEQSKPSVGQLPHFALRANTPRPPAKPFFKAVASAEKSVSDKAALERQSGDRTFIERMGVMAPTANFTPPPQRRITEIPNLNAVRALDVAADSKKLTIGKHIKVSGEISGCERLIVEGEVDATMTGMTTLDVAACGKVAGNAEVNSATVSGSFNGTLIVHGHLEIPSGASVHGTISYQTVSVANGAKLSGTISVIG
jgi:cytoskeletal protein CcmA (bactofilin family)